jgi:phosphoribosyl 1,2-cyclic phosphodiesterase
VTVKGFCPLASGSKGNAIYFESDEVKLLIDCGISYKRLRECLEQIGRSVDDLEAVLVTHEHSDHIKGIERLVKEQNIPVFANSDVTREIIDEFDHKPRFKVFTTGETFEYKDLVIHPFSIQHDTVDPVAFTIESGGIKLGLCTDLGLATSHVAQKLQGCNYLVVEANHEVDLVHASSRPPVYKDRVLSRQGHLSNEQCAQLIEQIYHDGLRHIFLAHLSEECNQPDIALQRISDYLGEKGIEVPMEIAHQSKVSAFIKTELPANPVGAAI